MTEAEAAKSNRRARPAVVFIYKDNAQAEEDPRAEIESHKAFRDDSVAIGARFFDCLRIDNEYAAKDRILKKYASMAPVLVFVRPNFETVKAIRGRFSARGVFAAMCLTMKVDYDNCVRTAVKKQRTLLKEIVKIDKLRVKANKLSEKIEDTKSAAKRGSLGKQLEKLEKQIDAKQTSVSERESKIYDLKPVEATTS